MQNTNSIFSLEQIRDSPLDTLHQEDGALSLEGEVVVRIGPPWLPHHRDAGAGAVLLGGLETGHEAQGAPPSPTGG